MIKIGANKLTLKDVEAILLDGEKVSVEGQALARVTESFEFLKEFSQDKVIYGINTGFGPMAQYRINRKHQEELQYNLIRSHCSGTGEAIPSWISGTNGIFCLSQANVSLMPAFYDLNGDIDTGFMPFLYDVAYFNYGSANICSGQIQHVPYYMILSYGKYIQTLDF